MLQKEQTHRSSRPTGSTTGSREREPVRRERSRSTEAVRGWGGPGLSAVSATPERNLATEGEQGRLYSGEILMLRRNTFDS